MNHFTFTQMQSRFLMRFHGKRAARLAETQPIPVNFPRATPKPLSNQNTRNNADTTHGANVIPIARAKQATREIVMHLVIDAHHLILLRQLAMGNGGDMIVFMRAQPIAHATKMKVWLCVRRPMVQPIMEAIMRALPSAEFGRFICD